MRCEDCGSKSESRLCHYCLERHNKSSLELYETQSSKRGKGSEYKAFWEFIKSVFKSFMLILILLILYQVGQTLSKGVSIQESHNIIDLLNMTDIVTTFTTSLNTDTYDTTLITTNNSNSLESMIPYLENCIQSADKLYQDYSKNSNIDSTTYEKLKSDVTELSERLETLKGKDYNTQLYYSMDDCTYYLGIFLESLSGNRYELSKKISDIHYYYEDVQYYSTSGK